LKTVIIFVVQNKNNMRYSSLLVVFFFLFAALATSCKDEEVEFQICPAGPGGDVNLDFYVYHNDSLIPGAIIYLKYNEVEFPGTDPAGYDIIMQTGTTGENKGYARLINMSCGKYFAYSEGYNPWANDSVTGGRSFEVTQRTGSFTVDILVE
jgi:hypothetical protein